MTMMRQTETVGFTSNDRAYTAFGWWDENQSRYIINSVMVHYETKRPVGTARRTRWVFRGLGGETKLQRQLILTAASLMLDRRLSARGEAA
jgi:hypothetical protein